MKDSGSIHQKVQDLCDCYSLNDPLKEMSVVKDESEKDEQEAALKWIALAVLHGLGGDVKKISISKEKDQDIKMIAKYREKELPSPGNQIGEGIMDAIKNITHIEDGSGKTKLAIGFLGNSIEMSVKIKQTRHGEEISLKFHD